MRDDTFVVPTAIVRPKYVNVAWKVKGLDWDMFQGLSRATPV